MTNKLKLLIHANDQGARTVADAVAKNAGDFDVVRFSADINQPVADEEIAKHRDAAAALFGLSSRRPEAEVVAQLKKAGFTGDIGFFEDFPLTAATEGTPAMKEAVQGATAFVIQPGSEQEVRDFGYGEARVTGIPDHWTQMVDDMKAGRDWKNEGRIQIAPVGGGETVTLTPEDHVVFLSGMQDPDTERHAVETLFAEFGERLRILFRAHPGERNRAELADAIARRTEALKGKAWIVQNEEVMSAGRRTNDFLIGIGTTAAILHPGSTPGLLTGVHGHNVVTVDAFVTPEQRATGFDYQRAAEANTVLTSSMDGVGGAIRELLKPDSSLVSELRRKQRANSPLPDSLKEPASVRILRALKEKLGL